MTPRPLPDIDKRQFRDRSRGPSSARQPRDVKNEGVEISRTVRLFQVRAIELRIGTALVCPVDPAKNA